MVDRIIFDLDDTLISSGKYYNRQLDQFARFVQQNFPEAGTRRQILARYDLIDQSVIAEIGLEKEHFPRSMEKTWHYFCSQFDRPVESDELTRCRQIGEAVYRVVPEPLPGMEEVLERLAADHELILYTMGDPGVQLQKIRYHRLDRWFEEFHIFPWKDRHTLQKLLGLFPAERTAIVGDSLRGEIKPGLELGLKSVHLRSDFPWTYHEITIDQYYPVVDSLPEILAELVP